MINFNIEIARTVFRVQCRNESLRQRYADYITDKEAELSVCASDEELAETRESYQELRKKYGDFKTADEATIEALVHHKQVAGEMLRRGVLLVHGSAVAANGKAYMFIAPSRTGKSTHTKLWLGLQDVGAYIINDDKPMLRPTEDGVIIYSTPWGQRRKPEKSEATLKAIAVLERGEKNIITPIGAKEMFPELFRASLRGDKREETMLVMDLEDKILSSVCSYRLKCNTEPEAAQISYNMMANND